MTTYDELTPDALFLLENLSELDIVQDCADRGAKIAELREELVQQRERADNAHARLDLARQALVIDGYFTRAEVGDEGSPDIAPRITELTVHLRGRVETAETALAALHEGEEPDDDDRLIPTPGQWIWRWNRATPAERLEKVQGIQAMRDQQLRLRILDRDWYDAQPLLPGQALADLRNAMSDNPQPVYSQAVQAGEHLIRVTGYRVPTPDERAAIGALLDANEAALGEPTATGGIYSALHKAVAETVTPPVVGETVDYGAQPLTARVFGVAIPSCESGRHFEHPGDTCEEYDNEASAWQGSNWYEAWVRQITSPFGFTVAADVPTALRGPNCPRPTEDPAPLRKLAEQAFAEGGPLPGVRPFVEVMANTDRVPDVLLPTHGRPSADGLYEQVMATFGGPLPQDRPPLCPCGAQRLAGRVVHNAGCWWMNDHAALVEQRKCKVIVPHAFQQVADVDIAVCTCTKSPGHHIHTGDRAACTCDECHTEEPTP